MNLRALLEWLALASAYSPNVIEARKPLACEPLERLWCAGRARQRLWRTGLVALERALSQAVGASDAPVEARLLPLAADILAGDVETRLYGAIATAADLASGHRQGAPLVRNLLVHQTFARNRILAVALRLPKEHEPHVAAIDRLRRRLERWSDLLVGHLVRRYGLVEFAFDAARSRDFGDEQLSAGWEARGLPVWDLYLVALRTTFPGVELPSGPAGELRDDLTQAMLSIYPPSLFDDSGVPRSIRLCRLLAAERASVAAPRRVTGALPRNRWE